MKHLSMKSPALLLSALTLAVTLSAILPWRVEAGDVGVGRRTGGIAEIDLVSAVHGSTVVRSLPTQEGAPQGFPPGAAPDLIRILDLATGNPLASGNASADGQYNVVLPKQLTTGQRIQAVNVTRGFYSSSVSVTKAQPPALDEPVLSGATIIKGRGTPGSKIEIRNVVTGALLGMGTSAVAPGLANGTFSIKLSRSLPLFHTIRARDATNGMIGRVVPILNLLTTHSSLLPACGSSQVLSGGFLKKTFSCGLPRPRGIALDANGNPLLVAGTAPLDPGYALLPAGVFRLSPATGALSLFAPVSGVALESGPGGIFGANLFVARPRFFNIRGKVFAQPGDGEIFRVTTAPSQVQVFTRLLDFAPTGMAFGGAGTPFPNELLASNLFGVGLQRIKATGAASTFTKLPGLQGLAFGPGGKFGSDLYAAQPGSGQVLRISASGVAAPFAKGLISPVDVAFGPGGAFGADLYVADAGAKQIVKIDNTGARTLFASGFGAPFGLVFRTSPLALFVTDYLNGNVVQFTPGS